MFPKTFLFGYRSQTAKAPACPELIETWQEPNAAAYRELAEATGELLPGIEAVPERESFRVRFGKGIQHARVTEGGEDSAL